MILSNLLLQWLLPLLIYSGPVLPLLGILILSRFDVLNYRKMAWRLTLLLVIHILMFLPYAIMVRVSNAAGIEMLLTLPALTGMLTLLVGSFWLFLTWHRKEIRPEDLQ